jgi:predicted lipid-binding transport protein (Tim44 family)
MKKNYMNKVRAGMGSTFALLVLSGEALAAPAAEQGMGVLGWVLGAALVAGAGVFVVRMMKNKDTPANSSLPSTPAPAPVPGVTRDFDVDGFLRQSKVSFVRMQAAWDKADTNDLREFTTPEVFSELKAQVDANGPSGSVTEVVSIDAELLGVEKVGPRELATVKFTGMIKSSAAAAAEPFAEVWNMAKPQDGSTGWMLAGIQQLS